jgi:hypothetical protein
MSLAAPAMRLSLTMVTAAAIFAACGCCCARNESASGSMRAAAPTMADQVGGGLMTVETALYHSFDPP